MSRSRKRPYLTDQQSGGYWLKQAKRGANRAVRQAMKAAAKDAKFDLADGKSYRKLYSSYDIRDWSFHCPKDRKAYRK
jgi:hypothetical protein